MKVFLGKEAEKFLAGLPLAKSALCKDSSEVVRCAKKFHFPVVLKIISKDAVHKTEIDGVKITKGYGELRTHYTELMRLARDKKIKLDGILVQEFVKGTEIIAGIKNDATFGHVIMFGIGGAMVELLKDVSFRVCPITEQDAESMVEELKLKQILYGFRGSKPVDIRLLKSILVQVSKIPLKYKKIEELDINPLIINDKTARIVDARVVLA